MIANYTDKEVELMDELAKVALQSILRTYTDAGTYQRTGVGTRPYEYAREMIQKRREVLNGKT